MTKTVPEVNGKEIAGIETEGAEKGKVFAGPNENEWKRAVAATKNYAQLMLGLGVPVGVTISDGKERTFAAVVPFSQRQLIVLPFALVNELYDFIQKRGAAPVVEETMRNALLVLSGNPLAGKFDPKPLEAGTAFTAEEERKEDGLPGTE